MANDRLKKLVNGKKDDPLRDYLKKQDELEQTFKKYDNLVDEFEKVAGNILKTKNMEVEPK